jgi:hypothetical protein
MSDDVINRLRNLTPGATVVYCQGYFIDHRSNPAASVALELARAGRVHLTQRRLPNGEGFEYRATGAHPVGALAEFRRRRPHKSVPRILKAPTILCRVADSF